MLRSNNSENYLQDQDNQLCWWLQEWIAHLVQIVADSIRLTHTMPTLDKKHAKYICGVLNHPNDHPNTKLLPHPNVIGYLILYKIKTIPFAKWQKMFLHQHPSQKKYNPLVDSIWLLQICIMSYSRTACSLKFHRYLLKSS